MKTKICLLMVLLLIFSVSSIWAMKEATTATIPTERTAPQIKKAEARPVLPDDFTPKFAKKGQVAPINDDYEATKSRAQRGGIVNVWEDDFETEGSYWYYAGASWIYALPDQYGDTEFGTRFTINHTTANLDGAWFYWYSAVGTPSAMVHVYDVVANYPDTELGSVVVDWADITLGWNYVDLSDITRGLTFDCGEELFITYSVIDGEYGVTQLNIVTDDYTSGANRSVELWGTSWGYMIDDWGADIEFCIDIVLSYPDTWTCEGGWWEYVEDSPAAKDTVSHSPTHCWWMDEFITGSYIKDAIVSPTFTLYSGFPLYFISLWQNVDLVRYAAGPGYIDENYDVYITDVDEPVPADWHTDSLNHYAGEKSWWCGRMDPAWAGGWGYGNNWDQWIETPELSFAAAKDSICLDFMHRYDVEPDYDFCYLNISTDDWATQTTLATYNDTIGLHNTWTAEHINLSAYAGQDVKIRFQFTSDGGWSDEDGENTQGAWFIDNVVIADYAKVTYFEDNADDKVNFIINPGNYLWTRLWYEYQGYDGWTLFDKDLVWCTGCTCDVTAYAGKDIKIKIGAQIDDVTDIGKGFGIYIDDIAITGIDLPPYDMACDITVVPYPTTVGLDCKSLNIYPKLIMHEAGYASTGAKALINVEGTGSAPPLWSYYDWNTDPPLELLEYGIYDLARNPGYTPVAGTYNYDGWVELDTDPNPDNDHAPPMPVTIYPEGEYELGYNSRVEGQWYFPTCTGAVTYYSPFRDGIFSSKDVYQITGIRHMLYNRFIPGASPSDTLQWAPLTFKIYNAADSVTLGALIYEEEIMIPSQTRISWIEFPFAIPVPITDDYFVHITGEFIDGQTGTAPQPPLDHPEYFMLVDDNSEKYLGTSYYSGHAFNYGISAKDSLELHDMDYWVNTLINVDVPLPGYCENLAITSSGKDGDDIVLVWKAMPNATDYKVYYSTDPYTGFTELVGTTGGAATYTHTGGASATKYFYQVTGF
ncbi:MAG: hypothetical protein RAP03_01625 [Candidatus Electryonea clarkiae]|nr:hypothetical protein [Candidatus Electryonea clarkiae]